MRRRWQIVVLSQHIGIRMLCRIVFKRMGHAAEIVTTRGEAAYVIKDAKELPDLVILDLYLSDAPGLAFASNLRGLYPQLPILLIPPHDPGFILPQEDLDTAAQLGVKILDSSTGIGGHHFNLEIHKLVNRTPQESDTL